MKCLLLMGMAFYGLSAGAQIRPSENYVQFSNDSVLYASEVSVRSPFGTLQLRADGRQIPVHQVKFFNNSDGYFANTQKLSFFEASTFSERVITGKLNVYQAVNNILFEQSSWWNYGNVREQQPITRNYYNKGNGPLKKVTYANLMYDMADDRQSIDMLKAYKRKKVTGFALYTASAVSIIASSILFMKMDDGGHFNPGGSFTEGRSKLPSALLLGASLGAGIGGFFMQESAKKQIGRAIDYYNR